MSTPKPGQIRCPTCLRSTPPAAYCTQCGSPIPPSARVRPRGLDRDELEERVRRRPGEGPFRRGSNPDDAAGRVGYVPFEPEPEDALAVRPEGGTAPTFGGPLPDVAEEEETRRVERPRARAEESEADARRYAAPAAPAAPVAALAGESPEAPYAEAGSDEPYEPYEADDDRPYGEPEDAYAYPYRPEEPRRGGGGALPIVGFVVLCVLALAVGAVLAGLIGGDNGVASVTPTPGAASVAPTTEPTTEPTPGPSQSADAASPEPTDGPVAFADGALYEVQPCGTYEFKRDLSGCVVDGSTRNSGDVWILVVFSHAVGSDQITLSLRQNDSTIDQQDTQLGSIVNCANRCNGLIWGAVYRDLDPGDYELVLRRNGDFADRATFTVSG
jgi:hypothetical protein